MGDRGRGAKFVVRLSGEERADLECMIRTGRAAAYRLLKARILLKADAVVQPEKNESDSEDEVEEIRREAMSRMMRTGGFKANSDDEDSDFD